MGKTQQWHIAEVGPMASQEVVIEQIDHDAGEAAARGTESLLTLTKNRMAIGKRVDEAVQLNARRQVRRQTGRQRAFYKITEQAADLIRHSRSSQKHMRQVIQPSLPCLAQGVSESVRRQISSRLADIDSLSMLQILPESAPY